MNSKITDIEKIHAEVKHHISFSCSRRCLSDVVAPLFQFCGECLCNIVGSYSSRNILCYIGLTPVILTVFCAEYRVCWVDQGLLEGGESRRFGERWEDCGRGSQEGDRKGG